jgi:hypothetical protein
MYHFFENPQEIASHFIKLKKEERPSTTAPDEDKEKRRV